MKMATLQNECSRDDDIRYEMSRFLWKYLPFKQNWPLSFSNQTGKINICIHHDSMTCPTDLFD